MIEELSQFIDEKIKANPSMGIVDGTVLTLPPNITVRLGNSDITLDADQLIVSERFLDRTLAVTTDALEQSSSENGSYTSTWIRGSFTFASVLEIGDTVLMLKAQGGQKFYILDRGVSFGSDT